MERLEALLIALNTIEFEDISLLHCEDQARFADKVESLQDQLVAVMNKQQDNSGSN
ncbi:hypothetical protein [Marinomonas pontica]|uniref:hypothetical protein n=1 Tax=Marinomonas pontica TaxID=264739 RepID=UPI0030C6A60C